MILGALRLENILDQDATGSGLLSGSRKRARHLFEARREAEFEDG